MPRPSEDELIATYFAPLAGPGAFGLNDDAAVLVPPPGQDLVATTDMVTAGVHFFPNDPPGAIARKALRVNLSDLAAKGAEPCGFLMSLALPADWTAEWLAGFAQGLGEDALAYQCPLLGGDTVKTLGPLVISVTALGTVPAQHMIPRAGALTGDRLYVTGTIGDAALGLKLRGGTAAGDLDFSHILDEAEAAYLAGRYLLPQPRLGLRQMLQAHARAAMDISDGLAGDLVKFLQLTGMTAEILSAGVPLSKPARKLVRRSPSLIEVVLTGGDDYELLCAVPPGECAAFEAGAASAGVSVHPIGTAEPGRTAPKFKDSKGQDLVFAQLSFRHF